MQIADFLISVIRSIGVTQGFSLVGGMAMHLNRAAGQGLNIIYCNHEQAVVAAADGYSKAADYTLPGLAIVTSGPGVTNTVTSLTSAYYDSVPLILLAGQVKSLDINHFGVRSYGAQEVPHNDLLLPITKLTFTYHPALITNADLARNLASSMTGRKGPVHIDVPLDVQSMDIKTDADVEEVVACYNMHIDEDASQTCDLPGELINHLKTARRSLVILGNGLKIASVQDESIASLLEHLGFPVLLTWASMDLLDYDHPMVFGCAGGLAGVHSNRILQSADLIIFLGTRLDLLTTGFNPANYGKNAHRYVFDCDTAELSKYENVKCLMGIKADVRAAIRALINAEIADSESLIPWISQCRSWQTENNQAEDKEFSTPCLNIYHVASLIASAETTPYVVPSASGYAIEGFARFYKPTNGSRFAWAGHVLGSMGLALPSALGASTRLKKCVACVDGDGGLLLNVQELYTFRANPDVPIALFILNNRGYESIAQSQSRAFNRNFGATAQSGLAKIDFEPLAHIAGLLYIPCHSYEDLKEAVSSIRSDSRVLIDIFLDDNTYRGPAITTKFDDQGRPYSTPLEDVSWR
jgi:acetolactate synthase-1/2/3 large subunit